MDLIRLSGTTFLFQWSIGGLFFLWVTTRRREVGPGYGWLLRSVFGIMLIATTSMSFVDDASSARTLTAIVTSIVAMAVLVLSFYRRPMPPRWDLLTPLIGLTPLVISTISDGGPHWLAILRFLSGAAILGCVTNAMLLGHWYLVQPGLARAALIQMNRILLVLWPVEVVALLIPTGMFSVISGDIDDSYQGLLGWFWIACVIGTLALSIVTDIALRERFYSAVMAATGFLYLAILTTFGMDLIARAVLAP